MREQNYFNESEYQWLMAKLGKISSSKCSVLFQGGKRPMTPAELAEEKANKGRRTTVDTLFGDGAVTYLQSLVCELTTGEVAEDRDFKQLEWGKANEMDAILRFQDITGLSVDYHGISNPVFIKYGDFAGGSPDGTILNPYEDAICECKCHWNGAIHMKKLLIRSVDEFKDKFWEEYCQDQMNMAVTGKKNCYSISYDPRKKDPRLQIKIIRIPIDNEWQAEFETRLESAIEMMADINSDIDKYLLIK
ncbi:MAG: YqaJ viral recombinase family protein [Chitinophagaceae bacterium]|nr:YqaJ viral recombinase family protein [Chitinophagaceae bacterium]